MWYQLRKFQTSLVDMINKIWSKGEAFLVFVPFTTSNIIWRGLDKSGQTILDVGCGEGGVIQQINRRGDFTAVGVDIFEPYLKACKSNELYHGNVLCDIRALPFKKKSFDVVMALQSIEHLEKEEGRHLIQALEEIARMQVIIGTPVGTWRQKDINKAPNPYQKHRAVWFPTEFKHLGYKVRGCTLRKLYDETGLLASLPRIFLPFGLLILVVVGPFLYFLPSLAGQQTCFKKFYSN